MSQRKDPRSFIAVHDDKLPIRTRLPAPNLSAGRNLVAQRYVVGWPEGIVKTGETWHGRQRWGTFLARGATMVNVAYYANLIDSVRSETRLYEALSERYRPAFTQRIDAIPYLGGQGAGWKECLAISKDDWDLLDDMARRF